MSASNIFQKLAGGSIDLKYSKPKVVNVKTTESKISAFRTLKDRICKVETELAECKSEVRILRNEIRILRSEKDKVEQNSVATATTATATATTATATATTASAFSLSPNILQALSQSAPNPLLNRKTETIKPKFKRSKTYVQDYFPDNCILEEVLHCEKEKIPSKMRLTYNKAKNHFLDLDDGTIYSRLCDATKDHISKSGIQKKNAPSAYSSFKMIQGNKKHSIERLDIFPIKMSS
jgi:hypothetical protein